jgi:hypothetical protein
MLTVQVVPEPLTMVVPAATAMPPEDPVSAWPVAIAPDVTEVTVKVVPEIEPSMTAAGL